jgi:hypothetical protein
MVVEKGIEAGAERLVAAECPELALLLLWLEYDNIMPVPPNAAVLDVAVSSQRLVFCPEKPLRFEPC